MLFNSLPFLAFIALFFAFWPLAKKRETSKWLWICSMSFLFYGWWDWRFLFLLIGTGTIDFFCGRLILNDGKNKKLWLYVSLISNIGSLAFFKYSTWLLSVLLDFINGLGYSVSFTEPLHTYSLALPIGISFYTFNSLSYTIDLYRKRAEPAKNLLHFMAFISFFPHLVAGPIIKARDVLQQLNRQNPLSYTKMYHGIITCIWGFFQKMVLADNLAVFVNARFDNVSATGDSLAWWICMLAFSFQIYFDFNGYSTIARGIAKLCGIHFRLNFNHPYRSFSFSEFWKRWHISLSTFFRDYVYISLGGNRKGRWRTEYNKWVTMLLSGLWHGANFTFICWGALHAALLSLESLLRNLKIPSGAFTRAFSFIFVFTAVLLSWVFFRANTMHDAFDILGNMWAFRQEESLRELLLSNAVVWLGVGLVLEFVPPANRFLWRRSYGGLQVVFWAFMLLLIIFFRGPEQDFIYFQF